MIRINKYICASGLYSRKTADQLVKKGEVLINGRLAKLGDKVASDDVVEVEGVRIEPLTDDEVVVLIVNKPVGVVCTTAKNVNNNIIEQVNFSQRIFPVGRLDKDSQGLILLTNKSGLADAILSSGNHHEKEYVVTVNKPITRAFIESMGQGVPVLGQVTKDCYVEQVSECVFNIILTQGLNRQIRRMCQFHGYVVEKLERVRIMHMVLGELPLGQWHQFDQYEVSTLLEALS